MSESVRVRFAPAPTGLLHIGNARTALFNYIFAKHHRGTFILRIEDTDLERSTGTSIDCILQDLRWLGIHWDEGPDKGGPNGPYRQSLRLKTYQEYANKLLKEGKAYKCFCSPERLESLRKEQLSRGMMPRYDGRCHHLSEAEIKRMESEGITYAIRFRVGKGIIIFEDLIHKKMHFDTEGIGDFIIIRSDKVAAYNFACVIDDHLMKITHVIRGDDHLSNTPRQILVYQAMGWDHPVFAHHPLLFGEDRSPLSKRHGSTAVSQYREEGFLPEALLNYLYILGWKSPSGEEIIPIENMIEEFSIQTLSRNAPIHSIKKLEWINSHYIKMTEDERLCELIIPYLEKFRIDINSLNKDYLKKVSSILKENLTVLSQVEEFLAIFFDEKFLFEKDAKTILNDPENREFLKKVLNFFEQQNANIEEQWVSVLSELNEGLGRKGRSFYAPLRAAITGKMKGPELVKILPLIGRERIIKRLKMAVELSD